MAEVTAVLEIVGASLTLVTVSTKLSVPEAVPSDAVTVIVCAPTSAFTGVPVIAPALDIDRVLGAPDMV